jgi:hypothetical protein
MREEIDYKTIAIEDMRYAKAGKPMQIPYVKMKAEGVVIPVEVPMNLTMDKPTLCPVKLTRIPGHKHGKCLPVMDEFVITGDYIDFLQRFGTAVGQDISSVNFQNATCIRDSEKYLPQRFTSVKAYEAGMR